MKVTILNFCKNELKLKTDKTNRFPIVQVTLVTKHLIVSLKN